MNHQTFLKRLSLTSGALAGAITLAASSGLASALNSGSPTPVNESNVQTIISKGDQEISRRLASLSKLDSAINATTKLSSSDKATLASEVNAEADGLTALKATLDANTTVAAARASAQSIFSDYRVYALVVPKVRLVTTADGQQNAEAKLTALIAKLQTRLNAAKSAGKGVGALESALADMQSQTNAAMAISSSVETKVLPLQPTDYNSDHTILSGYRTQLQTAHSDNAAAANDAKTIINGLKNF